jgi:hypothetical protein
VTIRDAVRRLRTDPEQLERERLRERFGHRELTPIEALPLRQHASVGGEVIRMTVRPRSGIPSFEVVIGDGTGVAVAVFTGRRSIAGVDHGRAMIIEGVARDERGRRVMLNPAYTLLPD